MPLINAKRDSIISKIKTLSAELGAPVPDFPETMWELRHTLQLIERRVANGKGVGPSTSGAAPTPSTSPLSHAGRFPPEDEKVIKPKLADLGAPALKRIARRLNIPVVLGRSPAEWRR